MICRALIAVVSAITSLGGCTATQTATGLTGRPDVLMLAALVVLALALGAALWFNPAVKTLAVKMIARPKDTPELLEALRQLEAKSRKLEAELEARRLEADGLRTINDQLKQENARLTDEIRIAEASRSVSAPVQASLPPPSASRPPPAPVIQPPPHASRDRDVPATVERLLESWTAIERLSDRPMDYRRALRENGVLALVQKVEALERLGDELITSGIVDYFAVPDAASGLYGLFVGPQFVNKRETLTDNEHLRARLAQYFQISTQDRVFRQVAPALVQITSSGFQVVRRGNLVI